MCDVVGFKYKSHLQRVSHFYLNSGAIFDDSRHYNDYVPSSLEFCGRRPTCPLNALSVSTVHSIFYAPYMPY